MGCDDYGDTTAGTGAPGYTGGTPPTLTTARDNHVWQTLHQAKGRADYRIANAKKRIDALGNEIQRHTRDILDAEATERAITAHAESMGWTLEPDDAQHQD